MPGENKSDKYKIVEFEKLSELSDIENCFSDSEFQNKSIFNYLKDLNAKFIVVEQEYINKDYLKDFSSYYFSCFKDYPRKCTRLHFFSSQLNKLEFSQQFRDIITKDPSKESEYWKLYLGFIVIRPVPGANIGYTLLKKYETNTNALIWGTKVYKVHVFGNQIEIDTLAFQEQDHVVAACASTAIWFMLQIAMEDYKVVQKSPGEITNDAGITMWNGQRLFPNIGLEIPNMCVAITKNGLVTEVRDIEYKPNISDYVRELIYAYSTLKIPVLLLMKIREKNEKKSAGHAVSVCGYTMSENYSPSALLDNDEYIIRTKSEKITTLFTHDDQIGPFTKIGFTQCRKRIQTEWKNCKCKIYAIIVPVFPKIRISYDDIRYLVEGMSIIIQQITEDELPVNEIVWDIQIYLSDEYKKHIKSTESPLEPENIDDKKIIYNIITKSFPKYIWVAKAVINGYHLVHVLFDATGIAQDMICLGFYIFDKRIASKFIMRLEELDSNEYYNSNFLYIEKFIKSLKELHDL